MPKTLPKRDLWLCTNVHRCRTDREQKKKEREGVFLMFDKLNTGFCSERAGLEIECRNEKDPQFYDRK